MFLAGILAGVTNCTLLNREQILARKRREYRDMLPQFYDIPDTERSEEGDCGSAAGEVRQQLSAFAIKAGVPLTKAGSLLLMPRTRCIRSIREMSLEPFLVRMEQFGCRYRRHSGPELTG